MNKDLLKAIDAVISNLDKLSNAELQAKYEECKHGPVGTAISDGKSFLHCHISSFIADYTFSKKEVEKYIKLAIDVEQDFIFRLNKIQHEAANDDEFQMAA